MSSAQPTPWLLYASVAIVASFCLLSSLCFFTISSFVNTVEDLQKVVQQIKGKPASEAKSILDNNKIAQLMPKIFLRYGGTQSIQILQDTLYILVDKNNIVTGHMRNPPGVTVLHGWHVVL